MTKDTVTIDRELFEWLVEYAIWLRGTCSCSMRSREEQRLREHIEQAVAIRDGVQKEGE